MGRWAYRIGGFLVGAGIAVGVEAALLLMLSASTSRYWAPRGLGWIVIPILAGVALAAFAEQKMPHLMSEAGALVREPERISRGWRLVAIASACWVAAVLIYVFVFNGLGRYLGGDDYDLMWKLIAVPPIFAVAAYWLYIRFGIKPGIDSNQPPQP